MITSEEMRKLEESSNIPRQVLMENAGKAVYNALKEKFAIENKNILVVCYHGNNGGDGFVAARHLCDIAEVDILFAGDESKMKKETLHSYNKIKNNEKIQFLDDEEVDFDNYDIIIDALIGLGMKGFLKNKISALIDDINSSKAFKVSIDVPSGLDPDTGDAEKYVNADFIVTFHDIKPSLERFKDKVVVANIGLPKPK